MSRTIITYCLYGWKNEDYKKELNHSLVLPVRSTCDKGIVTTCNVDTENDNYVRVTLLIRKGIYSEKEYLDMRKFLLGKGYYVD